jgi:CMP/dCMP kinase
VIIAIDGPSAAGKGTIGRALAQKLGYHYLDTGSLYRMVGFGVMKLGIDPNDEVACAKIAAGLDVAKFNDADLRGEVVGGFASKVAALPKVRAALLKFQRDFAAQKPGAVLDGRDIGTVICPEADFKFFITASVEARAKRRQLESPLSDYAAIKADIAARDARDAGRSVAPLKPAADAVVIDTSDLTPEQVLAQIWRKIEE